MKPRLLGRYARVGRAQRQARYARVGRARRQARYAWVGRAQRQCPWYSLPPRARGGISSMSQVVSPSTSP